MKWGSGGAIKGGVIVADESSMDMMASTWKPRRLGKVL